MKFIHLLSAVAMILPSSMVAQAPQAELVSLQKIYDKGGHNAFTDLIRFKNLFFCCFREALDHVGSDGSIRIMISSTGTTWVDYASISEKGVDLRDPKLEITPDGKRLYLLCGGSIYEGTKDLKGRRPRYSTTTDGKVWTPPQKLLAEGDWLWRTTVNATDKKFYGVSYNTYPTTGGPKSEAEWSLKSYTSTDGSVWQLSSIMQVPNQPNETTMRFLKDGSALALVRREGGDKRGAIGTAVAPYREWKWTLLPGVVQGQNFIELPDGQLIAASRGLGKTPGAHTLLYKMTPSSLEPILELPSGGDCSYPGLLYHENHLWVSYYSSHEGKASIYIAKVKLP
ncbi:MAG: exo-alpha-sialidase [Verrucomicrobia bacterium]|nr:exo-alpha-sialidase [Verrucomicrobiota bacterium]